jgi:hypothetical protein
MSRVTTSAGVRSSLTQAPVHPQPEGISVRRLAADAGEIAGLVYVCGFAPDAGESANALAQRFPGSTLGDALQPVTLQVAA